MTSLEAWIEEEARFAARDMLCAISATNIVKDRPGFGQRVTPQPGSVLASPVPAAYDPDPDYFFHWFRDSAIVIDAMRVAFDEGWLKNEALDRFREFVRFSQSIARLDGREFLAQGDFRREAQPLFRQYLRSDDDLSAVRGQNVLADVRVNPDGTLDFTRWARPQNDGPPLLVLMLLRWLGERSLDEDLSAAIRGLVVADLEFTLARFEQASFDIWEEESGFHYFTLLVQAEALARGGEWLAKAGDVERARACHAAAHGIEPRLAALWDAKAGFYRSRSGVENGDPRKALDMAAVLATLHVRRETGAHSVLDPKAQASLTALEDLFAGQYPINVGRGAPAMGRFSGDVYYGGGAWYVSTLAAAEFYFRLATALCFGAEMPVTEENARFRDGLGLRGRRASRLEFADAAMTRGDAFMATVRAFTPASGELSEQFDRATGTQTSAKRLAWSYAAFITAAASRRQACAAR